MYEAIDMPDQGWREVPMQNTPSRARPSGGWWKMAVIPARGDPAEGTSQMEFYVSNGSGDEVDKPSWGDTYRCSCPGGFKLQHGYLRPFPRARAAPTMLACPPSPRQSYLLLSLHGCAAPLC
jgi:hypothetical protein